MYRHIIRPLLFLFPPETIHHLLIRFLKIVFKVPGIRSLIRSIYHLNDPALETDFLGMRFSNPVGLAAGFDKNAEVFQEFHAFGFSFIEVGTVTPVGQTGNTKPRSFRLPADRGLINRMGFNNHGAEQAAVNLSVKRPSGLILGGNLGKNTSTPNEDAVADYEAVFRAIYGGVDYFVVNVSCPNITDLHKLQDQDSLEAILGRILEIRETMEIIKPVLLKISPDLNEKQLDETLEIVERLKIDGIVATNTTISREGLKTSREKIDAIGKGGMSGAPITQRSLEVVRYVRNKAKGKLPIIAVGGIMSVADALNMFEAGATLIQLYTGFIYEGPGLAKRINRAILKKRKKT
ncbi:MAG: quinone-dependent dihydroorotate dehydrogenase [Bacteroidales bacterium]